MVDLILRTGEASEKEVKLFEVTGDVISRSWDIGLYTGETNPNDIKLLIPVEYSPAASSTGTTSVEYSESIKMMGMFVRDWVD